MVLLVLGAAALIGIWITGRVVERALRSAVLASRGVFELAASARLRRRWCGSGTCGGTLVSREHSIPGRTSRQPPHRRCAATR
ncbi:hypothetical protein ACFQU7_35415 [Pseudoroseomonas wenyumeiae]